jgi:Fe-S cluster biogenesis protein NfuA
MSQTERLSAVQHVLDSELRPLLHFHGGDVVIAEVTPEGVVRLQYTGACHGCNLQVVTHFVTVRQRLLQVAGVRDVVAEGARLSLDAQQRIAAAYCKNAKG